MEEKNLPLKEETTENNPKEKQTKKYKKNVIIILIIFIIISACVYFGLKIYADDIHIGSITITNPMGITDKYLNNNFNQKGFDQFDSYKVHKVACTNINYNGYDKLVLSTVDVTYNSVIYQRAGLLLVNRKKDSVSGFTINNNIAYILYGICKEPCNQEKAVQICADYITKNGTDVFSDTSEINMINDLTNIISVKSARQYIEEYFRKDITNKTGITSEYTLLYTKGTAIVSYIAFKDTGLKFNSSYPIDERMYNYFNSSYSYKNTLNTLRYVYGDPYVLKTFYTYIKLGDSSVQGSKDTLNEVKKFLNVEELNEISIYENNLNNSNDTKTLSESNNSESIDTNIIEDVDEPDITNESEDTKQEEEEEEKQQQQQEKEKSNFESENTNNNYSTTKNDNYTQDTNNYEISKPKSSEKNEPKQVNVYNIKCYYPKFDDGKAEMERQGLKVNEILQESEIQYIYYSEESDDKWDYEGNKTTYNVGETVNVIHKKYKKIASRIRTRIDFKKIFDDTNRLPLLKQDNSQENCGIQVYMDDELAFTYKFSKYYSTSQSYEYSFEPDKTIHIKLVAPSYCPYDYMIYYGKPYPTDEYGDEWIIKEYDVDTNDIPSYFDLYTLIKWY